MIVYNTTFNIENDILAECIEYLKKSYIPRAAASGFLRTPYLRRILQDETEDATSYSVQFHVKNPEPFRNKAGGLQYLIGGNRPGVMTKDRVILGIDPGTIVMGYGVLKIEGNKPKLEAMGVLQLNKYEDHYLRLKKIFERVLALIDQYHPDELAIEAPFFGKNVQSMLKLGRAQGVAMAAALEREIPIFEYAPLKIKMSITGNGNAAKEQVAGMLQRFLHIPQESMLPQLDATDGLAAAVCHYFQTNNPISEKKYSGWKDFMAKNPGKVRK